MNFDVKVNERKVLSLFVTVWFFHRVGYPPCGGKCILMSLVSRYAQDNGNLFSFSFRDRSADPWSALAGASPGPTSGMSRAKPLAG
jgi:hypothetical protein